MIENAAPNPLIDVRVNMSSYQKLTRIKWIIFVAIGMTSLSGLVLSESMGQGVYPGNFLNYPDTDYEGVFLPCGKDEVWWVEKDDMYSKLLGIYNGNPQSQYGETYFVLRGRVEAVDLDRYPQSHLSHLFTLQEIVEYSTDEILIEQCSGQ